MKLWLLGMGLALGVCTFAQAQTAKEMKSASPESRSGESDDQKAQRLLAEMVKALGGDAWLNKRTEYIEAQRASFFRGAPTGVVVQFIDYVRFPTATEPANERIDFLTPRGVILPEGYKRYVTHLWTANHGYEYTYKGRTDLPVEQVTDYMRRRRHSIEEVMRTWVKAPGVMVVYEGQGMRDRRAIDKVTVLSADNDAVTLELDQETHLPIERSFEWRNDKFKDHDVDEEVYGDWRMYDGVSTPMNVTRYRNGDMSDEIFYKKLSFNRDFGPDEFNEEKISLKKK
jgi:hypothetical protein